MRINKTYIRYIKAALVVIILVSISIYYNRDREPQFKVYGDNEVLAKMKINVEVIFDENSAMKSVLFNGKSFNIDNENSIAYHIYVSYNDTLLLRLSFDNLHKILKGKPCNDIYVRKDGDAICVNYVGFKEVKNINDERLLIPVQTFYLNSNISDIKDYSKKFSQFYK